MLIRRLEQDLEPGTGGFVKKSALQAFTFQSRQNC
jgi:hypothetical protein